MAALELPGRCSDLTARHRRATHQPVARRLLAQRCRKDTDEAPATAPVVEAHEGAAGTTAGVTADDPGSAARGAGIGFARGRDVGFGMG
jgi:hypothetical protein